jgi:hypothetical protein
MKKKVSFSIAGKRYEVDLDNDFAMFVVDTLNRHNITPDRDSSIPKLLNVYLHALKENYETQKEVEKLLLEIPI